MSVSTPARFILASTSPRRQALLKEAGFDVEVMAPPLEEPNLEASLPLPSTKSGTPSNSPPSPSGVAEALSYFKAKSVADHLDDAVVLAGDTVVSLGGQLFGKPADRADACDILHALQGTTHQVISGVALVNSRTGQRQLSHASTDVTMRKITDQQLQAYLDTGAWQGKAGAFGLQDHDDPFVSHIDGSFTNVVGMPMELVRSMLASWDIVPTRPTAAG